MGRKTKAKAAKAMGPLRWLQLAGIALSFFGVFHFNIVVEYAPKWWYERAKLYQEIVNIARVAGFAPIWKMYSPPPRYVHRYEWWGLDGDQWIRLPSPPDLSAKHRAERSMLDSLLFDAKRGRVLDNYFHYYKYYDRRLPEVYARFWRPRLAAEVKRPISQVRVIVKRRRTPPLERPEPWPPPLDTFDEVWLDEVYQ